MKTFSLAILTMAIAGSAFAQLKAPTPQLLIPAAGSVVGSNGTFFHSDIAIFNYRNADQTVMFQWLPRGTTGLTGTAIRITVNALSGIIAEDFVADRLHQSGLG